MRKKIGCFKQRAVPLTCCFLICLLFTACGRIPGDFGELGGDGKFPGESVESMEPIVGSAEDGTVFEIEVPENPEQTFRIESETASGYVYDAEKNTYTVISAGTYDCYGDLYEGSLIVAAPDDAEVILNLNGCVLTNSQNAPVILLQADEVDLSAKKDTENKICDLRTELPDSGDENTEVYSAAIYSACDLNVKGNGSLTVVSDCNNGIHSKDDLKIKNLTLSVKAVNNAIKGNDSLTIESGTVLAVSTGGDALKTTSTDTNKNGETRGSVEILGGTVTLYAACDGIDAASDVVISGEAVLTICTDCYSPYSGDIMVSDSEVIYLRVGAAVYNANYKYAVLFSDADGNSVFVSAEFYKQVASSSKPGGGPGGGRGGPGGSGSSTSYYYYKVEKPGEYTSMRVYAYSESQEPGQAESYLGVSEDKIALSSAWDTFVISAVSGGTVVSSGWTNFQSSSGNTGLDYSCKGIKAGNTVTVSGGTTVIQSKDDAIHANFDTVLESTGKNGLGNVLITGGILTLASDDDGIHADQDIRISGGTVSIKNSYEGLEANRIYISDGSVTAYARDDAANANSKGAYAAYIEISGGYVDLAVPSGDTDTMDSNGTILISGGTVILKNGQSGGSSGTGGTIDVDRGVSVTGGTVIAIGCIGTRITNAVTNTTTTFQSGSYTFEDQNGNVLATFELTASYRAYMIWSERFTGGETYLLRSGADTVVQFTK